MTNPTSHPQKKLRKWPFITVGVVAAISLATWLSYKKIVAYAVSDAIVKDSATASSFLLGPYKSKIKMLKAPINRASEQLIYRLDSLHIPFDVFLEAVDHVDKGEIIQTLQELKSKRPEDTNEVFDIVKENITVKEFDPEIFRKSFLKYATMKKINQVLQYIELHNLAEEIDISISREIIKKVLIQKKEEITQKLKASGGVSVD